MEQRHQLSRGGLTSLGIMFSSFLALSARAEVRMGMGDELAFIASDQGACTGYVINSSPRGKNCEVNAKHTFVTAAHCSTEAKAGGRDWRHTSDSIMIVTGSSAGHPLDFVSKTMFTIGTSAAGAGVAGLTVASHVIGAFKSGSEIAVRTGNERKFDETVDPSSGAQPTGLTGTASRLSAARPFIGTYHKFPTAGFHTNVCTDSMNVDVTSYFKNRDDIKVFDVANHPPKRGEKLRAMGFAEGPGRADLSGCKYEGAQIAPKSDMHDENFAVDQVLHKIVCPEGIDPRGMSGGPVLNSQGEVVGTVVRGGQYPKGKHTSKDKLHSTSLCLPSQINDTTCTRQEDSETVLLFSTMTQANLDCDGIIARQPSNFDSFINGNRLDTAHAKFDDQGCIKELQVASALPSGETTLAAKETFNSSDVIAKADECVERFLGICIQYTDETTARHQQWSSVQPVGFER